MIAGIAGAVVSYRYTCVASKKPLVKSKKHPTNTSHHSEHANNKAISAAHKYFRVSNRKPIKMDVVNMSICAKGR